MQRARKALVVVVALGAMTSAMAQTNRAVPNPPNVARGVTSNPNIAPGVSGKSVPGTTTNLPTGVTSQLPYGVSNKGY